MSEATAPITPPLDLDSRWADAALSTEIFAVDPFAVGGIALRAWPGPPRDLVCAWIRALLPAEAPLQRLPLHITEDRLLGGLSLVATLRAGRVVAEQGVLAQANGGALLIAMAERLDATVTSHLCGALDAGMLQLERDAVTATIACRFGVVALDEGQEDERVPSALIDRLAIPLDLTLLPPRSMPAPECEPDGARVARARLLLPTVTLGEDIVAALCEAADVLGIVSLRAPLLAAAVARVHAALEGRDCVDEFDAAAAARLVLGPRATRLPAGEPDTAPEPPPADPETPPTQEDEQPAAAQDKPLDDIVLAAAQSAIPPGLLDALATGQAPRVSPRSHGRAGALKRSTERGRAAGTRAGQPGPGQRLNLVETLRAAAPWQRLRRRERAAPVPRAVEVRTEDFRVTVRSAPTETCVIFSVDASGSAALQRLAEAKGAVEQVLSDCYVRRDRVALIAFRGIGASVLLPPTRSLVRVRRSLADLAGGGTTPLAAGIDAALALALDARKRGQTPLLVFMTDGRGNVPRADTGPEGARAAAMADALLAARAVRAADVRSLFLDTSPRARPEAARLAVEMGARYAPLPYVDASAISRQVRSLAGAR